MDQQNGCVNPLCGTYDRMMGDRFLNTLLVTAEKNLVHNASSILETLLQSQKRVKRLAVLLVVFELPKDCLQNRLSFPTEDADHANITFKS